MCVFVGSLPEWGMMCAAEALFDAKKLAVIVTMQYSGSNSTFSLTIAQMALWGAQTSNEKNAFTLLPHMHGTSLLLQLTGLHFLRFQSLCCNLVF